MDDLDSLLLQQLVKACSESAQGFDQYVGMTQPRRQLLLLVSQVGEISHAALQQQLNFGGATVTRLVKEFEADGLLSRRIDPKDNRFTLVALTETGSQFVSELSTAHQRFQTQLLAGLSTDEKELMNRLLVQLRTNIRNLEEAATPPKQA